MPVDSSVCAGELTHRLTIRTQHQIQSASGEIKTSEMRTFLVVWGSLQALSGQELVAAQQILPKISWKARIRYSSSATTITAKMVVLFKGVNYNIGAIMPDPRFADHLTLLLESGVSDNG